jgi:DNA-binding transcriptional regulator LsrR (DeoR family)
VVRSRAVRDSLLEEPDIRRTLQLAAALDIALVGIGSSYPAASALVRSGHLTKEQSAALLRRGAVGNILGRHLDVNGRLCAVPLNERIVGVQPEKLKKIPLVVGVAAGGLKAEAILGAVRGGYINALVTDEAAGQGMLQRLRELSPNAAPAGRSK